jgi:hypothetical protein
MAHDVRAVLDGATRRGVSVAASLTDAARLALKLHDGLAAVTEWEAEHGAFSAAELKACRRRLRILSRFRRLTGRRSSTVVQASGRH